MILPPDNQGENIPVLSLEVQISKGGYGVQKFIGVRFVNFTWSFNFSLFFPKIPHENEIILVQSEPPEPPPDQKIYLMVPHDFWVRNAYSWF